MVLRREVERARRAPAPHLDVGRLVGAHRHARRAAGSARSSASAPARPGSRRGARRRLFSSSPMPAHFGHHAPPCRSPLPLSWPICLDSAVAPRLQLLGAHLQLLALGLERRETRHVEERLRVLASFESGDHAGQVAAQLGDVEHGRSLAIRWSVRKRPMAHRAARVQAAAVTIATPPLLASTCRPGPWAAGSARSPARPASVRTLVAPSARRRAITSCTSTSGADAPAVRPTRGAIDEPLFAQVGGAVDHVGGRAQALGQLAQAVAVAAGRAADDDHHVDLAAPAASPHPAGSAWRSRCPASSARARAGSAASRRPGSRPRRPPTAWSA